ncbi:p-loop containing nucleoside triphosphate hydrolase protein [Pleurostoma richardsiae]|uniref:P-loop containing nucleoside triphosphate hydrolase protein n=1 Tax=Pleurostoma richardsiae TaxID=41990 RepID=A0AA38R428_9PEZI|nr:p-loop containing nucleoside triphosphate hydrolase protein [Pleurostoma richardsiae]
MSGLPLRSAAEPAGRSEAQAPRSEPRSEDSTTKRFFDHSSGKRINTDAVIAKALKKQYPDLELVITESRSCDLLAYASAGHASFTVIEDESDTLPSLLEWKVYFPPARRLDGGHGAIADSLVFGKFLYKWRSQEFLVYLVDGRDGGAYYPQVVNYYILSPDRRTADSLILAAGGWSDELHEEIWVFDQGYWQKSAELYRSIKNAAWSNVILDPRMKKEIIDDHMSFFSSRSTYESLKVPWKRGIIYYGPPGNGKTISIKAMMHSLYALDDPIPTLYVRSLTSFGGPEYSIRAIFIKARQYAPCYLVFEDLDTIVTDQVRSYFLNEVDGLKANDGIFMVGSTNHLDRLDPGISKRPSRFDRKYLFPDPNPDERIAYCHFWQKKLADNKEVEFPDKLCKAIADITDDFSFAYMQEAFVAALLAIARQTGLSTAAEGGSTREMGDDWVEVLDDDDNDDLDKYVLWVEIKKQVEILREGMEKKPEED